MKSSNHTNKKSILNMVSWRLFAILLGMVVVGLLSLIPYGLSLAGQQFEIGLLPELLPQFLVQVALYSGLILVSMRLGSKTGLGTPLLENWLERKTGGAGRSILLISLLCGLAAGALMILLDLFLFVPRLEAQLELAGEAIRPAAWQGFLASFYGGIVEEVLSRYFLLTLLAWLGSLVFRNGEGQPAPAVMWVSILISGLIFGLGHLPTAASLGITLSPLYILRTLALNSVGILYGWLYWKKGLASAMAAHFGTDLVVHVLGALLLT